MVLILTIHIVNSVSADRIPCVLINLSTQDLHLAKDEMLRFLIETDIELDEMTTMTVYNTSFYNEDCCLKLVSEGEDNVPSGKNFIICQADIDIHRKVRIQLLAKISEQHYNTRIVLGG